MNLNSFKIISDEQFRTEENFIAKGNVIIQNGSSILVADELEYNSKLNVISLIGNITFIGGEQFFEASEFEFDLKNKIGLIKNVYGSINFDFLESLKLSRKIDNEINEELFKDKEIKNVSF